MDTYYKFAVVTVNILGNSCFSHVTCYDRIQILYNETHTNRLQNYLLINNCILRKINLNMIQNFYRATLKIMNMNVKNDAYIYDTDFEEYFIHVKELGSNAVLIINCHFFSHSDTSLLSFASTSNGSLQFINCQFVKINTKYNTASVFTQYWPWGFTASITDDPLILLHNNINVDFSNCDFHGNNIDQILQTNGKLVNPIIVVVRNANYTATILTAHKPSYKDGNKTYTVTTSSDFYTSTTMGLISLSHTRLILVDSVIFHDITFGSVISLWGNSTLIIHGTVKFSFNNVNKLIQFHGNIQYIIIKENSIFNVTHNKVGSLFDINVPTTKYPFPFCFFQYFPSSKNEVKKENRKFLIQFYKNQCKDKGCYRNITIDNCHWLVNSLFKNSSITPLEVNNQYIQFINNSGIYKSSQIIEQS